MQLIQRRPQTQCRIGLATCCLVLTLISINSPSFAQDTSTANADLDCENILRQVAEGTVENLERRESIAVLNNAIVCHLQRIGEVAPDIVNNAGYTFTSENNLEQTVNLMTDLRRELQVGGDLYEVLQLQIAGTKDLMQEIRKDSQMTESFRTDMISEFQAEHDQFLALKVRLNDLNDQIRQFTNFEAPAIQREARYVGELKKTREIRRELTGLANAIEATLGAVASDPPAPSGSD